jgi:hypothetical protein
LGGFRGSCGGRDAGGFGCHVIWKIIIFILIFKIECAIGWDPLNLERGLGRSLVGLHMGSNIEAPSPNGNNIWRGVLQPARFLAV